MSQLVSFEVCTGGGGQALGLENAGFHHLALVELDPHACATLRLNRPRWNVVRADLTSFPARRLERKVDLVAAGVPCPPFSAAGKQLGKDDERDLFPAVLRIVEECDPSAVMIENVRGLFNPMFASYRGEIDSHLINLGYAPDWKLLQASDFGVPQLRPRVVMVAIKTDLPEFNWPTPNGQPKTVGETLYGLMSTRGWPGAEEWKSRANRIAPTIVGGSRKHGGPDLGPTRARRAWAELGVDGLGIAAEPPGPDCDGIMPKLTVQMVALLQGFPENWKFAGGKTAAYRQVGNAFPPPVAEAVGKKIAETLSAARIGRKAFRAHGRELNPQVLPLESTDGQA